MGHLLFVRAQAVNAGWKARLLAGKLVLGSWPLDVSEPPASTTATGHGLYDE